VYAIRRMNCSKVIQFLRITAHDMKQEDAFEDVIVKKISLFTCLLLFQTPRFAELTPKS
jgi:hypothetical protein